MSTKISDDGSRLKSSIFGHDLKFIEALERYLNRVEMRNRQREKFPLMQRVRLEQINKSREFVKTKRKRGEELLTVQVARNYKSAIAQRSIARRRVPRLAIAHSVRVRGYEILQRAMERARAAMQRQADQRVLDQFKEGGCSA